MALYTLMKATVALVHVVLLGHLVCTTMRHIVILTNALFLLVPTTISMQPSWQARPPCSISIFLLWTGLRLWFLRWAIIFFRRLALDSRRC